MGQLGVGDRWNRWAKLVPPLLCVTQRRGQPSIKNKSTILLSGRLTVRSGREKNETHRGGSPANVLVNFGSQGGWMRAEPRAAAGQSDEARLGYFPRASHRRPAAAGPINATAVLLTIAHPCRWRVRAPSRPSNEHEAFASLPTAHSLAQNQKSL